MFLIVCEDPVVVHYNSIYTYVHGCTHLYIAYQLYIYIDIIL